MADFIFPQARAWILSDGKAFMTADTGREREKAVLLFTDDDLARNYAAAVNVIDQPPMPINGKSELLRFLGIVQRLGVTHVIIDHTHGKPGPTATIEKVIADVQAQIEQESE